MNCSICQKPIVLRPTAAQRAAQDVSGKTAAEYTAMFTTHASCTIAKRQVETSALLRRLNGKVE